MQNFGLVEKKLKNYLEAKSLIKCALEIYKKIFGE